MKSLTNGMTHAHNNNNSYTYNNGNSFNNNNNEEPIIISNETTFMSKIVGKFPNESCKTSQDNSKFTPKRSSPNGLINHTTTPDNMTIFNNRKMSDGHSDERNQKH